ncbi:MAG: hypothetical protein JNL52_01525 [Flavobacteriales bacterium]|nr:hypothetical protein [Flavobacteriales bacterium]
MRRVICWAAILLSLLASVLFGLLWFARSQMDFNTEGRYLDEATLVVHVESIKLAYGTLSLLFLALALVLFAYVRWNAKSSRLGN